MTDNMILEEVKDKWFTALQGDLEHGVAWMNEEASREFTKRYPMISAFSEWLNNKEKTDD